MGKAWLGFWRADIWYEIAWPEQNATKCEKNVQFCSKGDDLDVKKLENNVSASFSKRVSRSNFQNI